MNYKLLTTAIAISLVSATHIPAQAQSWQTWNKQNPTYPGGVPTKRLSAAELDQIFRQTCKEYHQTYKARQQCLQQERAAMARLRTVLKSAPPEEIAFCLEAMDEPSAVMVERCLSPYQK
jgi:hypothetical protein